MKWRGIGILMTILLMLAIHIYFLNKIIIKHQVYVSYIVVYFLLYTLFSFCLLRMCSSFSNLGFLSSLCIGVACGSVLAFCALLLTNIIFSEVIVERWLTIFIMSNVVLWGFGYFPLLNSVMRIFKNET